MTERPNGGLAVAARVVEARQEAGLTTKALAESLDLSLWATERLERGEVDVGPYLDAVAEVTGRSRTFFDAGLVMTPSSDEPDHAGVDEQAAADATRPTLEGRWMILGSLVALVLVRFFTEVVAVLPRAATFIDIPIFILLVATAVSRPRAARPIGPRKPYAALALGLLAISVVSVLLNSNRIDLGPVLFFLYGFLAPIAIYAAAYKLWPPGGSLFASRLLVGLVVVQLLVAYSIQVPRFLSTHNPDVVSGTFGENAYQLVFFLLVAIGLLAAIYTFEKGRMVTRFIPLMVVGMLVIIFLAQFRALLATLGLSVLLLGVLLGGRNPRGALAAGLVLVTLVVTLGLVATKVPALKFGNAVDDVRANPTGYFDTRLRVARGVRQVYNDNSRFIVTGTGPGTYSSRAWKTFAIDVNRSKSAAASSPLGILTGGSYTTDVSEKYVLPRLRNGEIVSGSRAVSSPYSSYLSLLAEVGVFGFAMIVAAYVVAFVSALSMTRRMLRNPAPDDPLPALLCATTLAFFVLPQMALLENWLEVTRVTFLSWIMLAIVTKEYDARRSGEPV